MNIVLEQIAFLFSFIIQLFLAWLLFLTGLHLMKIRSFENDLDVFEKKMTSKDVIENWFIGWKFSSQRRMHHALIRTMGDKTVTRFVNVSGLFFLLVSLLAVMASMVQWGMLQFLVH